MQKPVLHVLLIEDNPDDAALMILELKNANGFQVVYDRVENERGMRAALEKKSWDLVLCDYNLPGFSAEKALQILEDLDLSIPFILVSGVISQDVANRMVRMGAHDYISKEMMPRLVPVVHRELALSYSQDELLNVLSLALEYKDWNTHGHSKRVIDLTVQLARKMGVNEVEIAHIRRGALLHDVGKIGIPDEILLKKGKLTAAERTQMEMHPQLAYDLLKPVPFLGRALDIPYCHHERWNGTGYPRQLEGEQIPLSARIFAVIDTFDALTSNRPYRDAMSTSEALDYIREQSGELFDPKVVEVFSKMMEST
jgi:response regulator RpfG family c-di-GMP phosphodiesterase